MKTFDGEYTHVNWGGKWVISLIEDTDDWTEEDQTYEVTLIEGHEPINWSSMVMMGWKKDMVFSHEDIEVYFRPYLHYHSNLHRER